MATLHDVLVLHAEIAALVRARIPIELGLRRMSGSVPGSLGALSQRLAVRLESGSSLVEAIQQEEAIVSPAYSAVIEASLAANRLPEALDGLVQFGRTLLETRRQLIVALLYPLIVAVIAYGLVVLLVAVLGPAVIDAWDPLSPLRARLLPVALGIQRWAVLWVPLLPVVLWLGLLAWSRLAKRWYDVEFLDREPEGRGLAAGVWIPGVAPLYRDLDRAHSTQVLALLLEHQMPLPRAFRLVAKMTRSRQLSQAYHRLADGVEQGRSLSAEVHFEPRLPRLIAQLLRAGAADEQLPVALQQASTMYVRRVRHRTEWLRGTLTPLLALCLGGVAALVLALVVALPLRGLFLELLQEI